MYPPLLRGLDADDHRIIRKFVDALNLCDRTGNRDDVERLRISFIGWSDGVMDEDGKGLDPDQRGAVFDMLLRLEPVFREIYLLSLTKYVVTRTIRIDFGGHRNG